MDSIRIDCFSCFHKWNGCIFFCRSSSYTKLHVKKKHLYVFYDNFECIEKCYSCLSPNNETFSNASDQCSYTSLNGNLTSCDSWEYDKADFQTTIVTDVNRHINIQFYTSFNCILK